MDLAAIYDAWASRLLAYMIALTRDRALAEDALHNLFVKLAEAGTEIRNPGPYLYRAARREALRARRRKGEEPLLLEGLLLPAPDRAPAHDPERLRAAMDRLPEAQAEVLLLHAMEGFTLEETARILEIPAGTAATRYRTALERLQEWLRP